MLGTLELTSLSPDSLRRRRDGGVQRPWQMRAYEGACLVYNPQPHLQPPASFTIPVLLKVKPASEEEAAVSSPKSPAKIWRLTGVNSGVCSTTPWRRQSSYNFNLILNFNSTPDPAEFEFEGFSKDICRSMISMMDVDRSGKLGLREFIRLWTDIRTWVVSDSEPTFAPGKTASSSPTRTDPPSCPELRAALASAGYKLNKHICDALMLRYGDKDGNGTFGDYIMCSVKLRNMMGESCAEHDG
ncbi:hypothetical protein HAZT_HAZT007673 [Hyalella azteca]|uniref:EF-hand domain-containing protein n=1 Tax=Hyalella azteca TaxID=294128 RepID=A0A6A0H9M5_HYAAZ|nr:hypothetical protein HAZT_HAZT007673 [Hyalella azteca]